MELTSDLSDRGPEKKISPLLMGSQDDMSTLTHRAPMLSPEATVCLESVFRTIRYPTDTVIEYLADDLRVPMAAIKMWFKKKRGEGRKSSRKVDASVIKLDYEPLYGLGGLGPFGRSPLTKPDSHLASVKDMEKQLDKLHVDDKNDMCSGAGAVDKDTILFVHDIVGSLVQIQPFPMDALVTKENSGSGHSLPKLEKISPRTSLHPSPS